MGYIEYIQKSLDYIEDNLENKLTLDELAQISLCSKFHFHRLFTALVGTNVMEYVRKRRLTVAARMLCNSGKSIIQVAVETGFESHAAFTRAFKNLFGIPPERYRLNVEQGVLFDKVDIRGRKLLENNTPYIFGPRIIEKGRFHVIGMEMACSFWDNIKNRAVPAHWEKVSQRRKEINGLIGGFNYGISFDSTPGEYFNYLAGYEVEDCQDVPEGMKCFTVPQGRYAAFSFVFDNDIQRFYDTLDYIFGIWLPQNNYELSDHIDIIEVVDSRPGSCSNNGYDIWVPIKN